MHSVEWCRQQLGYMATAKGACMTKRRQRGEGSVYQRGSDGLWVGAADLGWVGGRRKRKSVSAKTQREAVRKLAALRREIAASGGVAVDSHTVETWMAHWLDDIAPRRVRPSTLAGYRSKARNYIVPEIGRHRLAKLTPQHVRAMDKALAERDLSPATRLQAHAILSRALTVAHREGYVARNVAALVDPPTLKRDETEPLAVVEIAKVLAAAAGTPLESRWLVALMLGLRQGEALGLAWDDVDLDAGTLTVRRALQRVKGQGLVFVDPKSRKSKRTLPLPDTLAGSLRRHRDRPDRPPSELVWCQWDGRPIDPRADWAAWSALLGQAGVRHVRLHDARHVAATVLAANGVPDVIVSAILGHAHVQVTHGYQHASLEMMRTALASIETSYAPKAIEG